MIDWNSCPRRAPDLEINEVEGGFLVYQPDRDRLHSLNATAVLVLENCDGTLRAGELAELVGAAFGLPAPPKDDVAACVASLLQEGLLVGGDAPNPG